MLGSVLTFLILILSSGLLWTLNSYWPHPLLRKGVVFALVAALLYGIFKVLGKFLVNRIKSYKSRYFAHKTLSLLNIIALAVATGIIWVEDPQALFVAYGLVAAGVAVSLRDFFKNLAGSLVLLFTREFSVGDRIEIAEEYGDVIDIGLFYTTLMEIKNWVEGNQPTGRLVNIPNGHVLSKSVNNYSKDHPFIWDEISLPITYDSNWKKARDLVLEIIEGKTEGTTKSAQEDLSRLGKKYYLSKKEVQPSVFIEATDNWIQLHARYVVRNRTKRDQRTEITERILNAFESEDNVTIASETLDVVGFPKEE